ncbi:hypothetical protein P7C70_g6606, partial [Phenoliferia sp. Uapishka_3]
MPSLKSLLPYALLATAASAHMSPWMSSMNTDVDPFAPLGPGWSFDDWWFRQAISLNPERWMSADIYTILSHRGSPTRTAPPADGAVSQLPAGGNLMLEIACNIAFTTIGGNPNNNVANDIFMTSAQAASYQPPASTAPSNYTSYPFGSADLALAATTTSSSDATGQPSTRANDGVLGGYVINSAGTDVGNDTAEWSSNGQGVGAWLTLTWSQATSIGQVVLYDRPNPNDHCTGFTLTFSGGVVKTFGNMNNDGSATMVSFPAVSTSTLTWTCTSVSAYTTNAGLSEIQVYGAAPAIASSSASLSASSYASSSASASVSASSAIAASSSTISSSSAYIPSSSSAIAPSASASSSAISSSPTFSSSSAIPSSSSAIPSSSSAPLASSSSFSPSSVSSSSSAISSSSSIVKVASSSSIVASTSASSIPISSSSIKTSSSTTSSLLPASSSSPSSTSSSSASVPTGPFSTINLAFSATVTASSWSSADDSPAARAIDGIVGGYLDNGSGDQTTEWESDHEGVGATLTLSWSSAVSVAKVILFDRPNVEDRVMGGTLTFSDGSVVQVPALPNTGTALPITFAARSTTSIVFRVTSVSSQTASVGLSEIMVYGLASSSTASGVGAVNWARYATVSATSSASQQAAYKAIDNLLDGYSSGDPYDEWASKGGKLGTTFTLTWASPVTLNSLVIFDRPNLNDWITGATVTFSDGGVATLPSLVNAGSATTFNLGTSVTTTSIVFKVTAVGSASSSVGLAEFQAFTAASTLSSAISVSVVYGGKMSSASSPPTSSSKIATPPASISSSPSTSGSISSSASAIPSSSKVSSASLSRRTLAFDVEQLNASVPHEMAVTFRAVVPRLISKAKREQMIARDAALRRASIFANKVRVSREI